MEKKYWVPALEQADGVLRIISEERYKHRLIDLSNQLGIHKSSMYSLLHTMEALNWIGKNANDTYAIGSATGRWGDSYLLRLHPSRNASSVRNLAHQRMLPKQHYSSLQMNRNL